MWPKILMELLPHLSRLVPAADRYFSSRSEKDTAYEDALVRLREEVRGGVSRLADEQTALKQELHKQAASSAEAASQASRARAAVEALDARVAAFEARQATAIRLLWAVLAMLAVVVVLLAIRIAR